MYLLAKYNTQTTFYFPMVKRGVVDLAVSTDWTPATGDTKVSKDGGNVANTTNNPAAVGGTGSALWSLTLTATELSAADVTVQIVDSATKAVEDQVIKVYTYGNASAKIIVDLSDAVRFGLTALPPATPGAAGGLLIAGTNAATTFSGTAASGATPATPGLTITGGAASTTGGGVAAAGLAITGGAGAASTNGAAAGATFAGGGTNTVASAAHGISVSGTSTGSGISAGSGAGSTGDGITLTANSTNGNGFKTTGAGTGAGMLTTGGGTGVGFSVVGGGTSGDGIKVVTTSGHGLNLAPVGTSMHGILATGGNGGTSDGIKAVAGTGGVDIRGNITGNITGNLSGSAGSVTGAVGSVTGAVGSVTGNVGGNVVGSVGSVTGAVGSVTANVTVGGYAAGQAPLQPTTAGRTLDVSLTGEAGIDWANIGSPTTTVNLSGTTVLTATSIAALLPAALVGGRMDVSVGAYQTGQTPLQPTVAGRTLDVSATGEAGLDWANIGAPTTTVNLSGTSISSVASDVGITQAAADKAWNTASRTLTSTAPQRVAKNTALANFMFLMVDSADHVTGKTGLTITATRSIDGGVFAACANSAAEVGSGIYKINLAASDLNGDVISFKFAGTGADSRLFTVVTQP